MYLPLEIGERVLQDRQALVRVLPAQIERRQKPQLFLGREDQ